MKRLLGVLIVFIFVAIGSPANAQTSTPTPGPICGAGYYEETASCVIYTGSWSTNSVTGPSGGAYKFSTTVGNNLQFRMYGTTLVLYRTTATTGTTGNLCVDAACQTISFNSGSTLHMQALSYEVACLSICNISITHNGSGGSFIDLDAFAIFVNQPTSTPVTPLPTWTSQVITPLPTWTSQVITPLPTWTAAATWTNQVPTAAATWTAQGRSQYILTNGLYEEFDAGLNFVGAWSPDSSASYSDGFSYVTTSQSSYLSFTMRGRFTTLVVRKITTGDDVEVCVLGGTCTVYDANGSNAYNASILVASPANPLEYTVIVRKATNDATPLYIDRVSIQAWATETPLPTWTAFPTPVPYFTQIPPLTQIPYPTPPPYLTQIAPLTEIPQFTEVPQFTQLPYPTPLETWTAQPGGYTQIPPLTQIPYPTPLDTWTAQPNVVITFQGTVVAAIDWSGLMTIYPTLITQVPPSNTPTETLTPSITPTPTETGTPTPPGYMQVDLPNAEGTTVATGTIAMSATAGEVGTMILLFLLSMIGLVFTVRSIFEGRKSPV